MPKKEIDYSKTTMYKIVCNTLTVTDLYVGHTTQFTKRKNSHKNGCDNTKNKNYNLKLYSTIRNNGGWENWTMVEIEKYPCKDKNEATARERYWYEMLTANLNIVYPQRSKKEYINATHDKQLEYWNKSHLKHKAKIMQWRSEHNNCPCGGTYTNSKKSDHIKTKKHQNFINGL